AIAAREHVFEMAQRENIDVDLERRGILHIYHDAKEFESTRKSDALLAEGGLARYPLTASEHRQIEPTLQGDFHAGFYTPSDATGDIHKFTRGLADACKRHCVEFLCNGDVLALQSTSKGVRIDWRENDVHTASSEVQTLQPDAV